MQRRILATIVAFVLAAAGAVLLISYIGSADDRARASEEGVDVLVVTERIAAGTSAGGLDGKVEPQKVPASLVAADAVTDVAVLGDRESVVELVPGEQVRNARFVVQSPPDEGDAGTEKVSLALDSQRAVGGNLTAGDRVYVFLTRPANGASVSERIEQSVKVTGVSGGVTSAGSDSSGAIAGDGTAGGPVTVTLALTPDQAKSVIAGMHDDAVWLSLDTTSGGNQ